MALSKERRSEILLANIEEKDCGVIALMAVTKLSREDARETMATAGFSPDGGTPRGTIEKVLLGMGYGVEVSKPYRETPATFSVAHEYGTYLLYIYKHVMPLVEGDLYNARGHTGRALEMVTKVTLPSGGK